MARRIGVVIVASAHTKKTGIETNRFLHSVKEDTTILKYQIDVLKSSLKTPDIVVVTGYKHEDIYDSIKNKISIVENDLWETTSVVRSIALGLRVLTNHKVLIIPSCLVFRSGALKGVDEYDNGMIISDPKSIPPNELGILTEKNLIKYVDYDFGAKWSQLSFFSGQTLSALRVLCEEELYQRHLFHELINFMLNYKKEITPIFNRRCKVYDVVTSKDIENIRRTKYASIM